MKKHNTYHLMLFIFQPFVSMASRLAALQLVLLLQQVPLVRQELQVRRVLLQLELEVPPRTTPV